MTKPSRIMKCYSGTRTDNAHKTSTSYRRLKQRKQTTKAEMKRTFFVELNQALSHIAISNRISDVVEKKRHLLEAEKVLSSCVESKKSNHLVRLQYRYIKEALFSLEEKQVRHLQIPILFEKYPQYAEKEL